MSSENRLDLLEEWVADHHDRIKELEATPPSPPSDRLAEALDAAIALVAGPGNGTWHRQRPIEEWQRLFRLFSDARAALADAASTPNVYAAAAARGLALAHNDWPVLANVIREVDGNHDLGAGELAERILSHPKVADAASTPEATLNLDWAKFIAQEFPKGSNDWACAECHPDSDYTEYIEEGFQCVPHEALAALAAQRLSGPTAEESIRQLADLANWTDDKGEHPWAAQRPSGEAE